MSIEPSGSYFLDHVSPRLLVLVMVAIMFFVAVAEIRDGYLGVGFVLMAGWLFMVGFLLLMHSSLPQNEYDTPLLVTIGLMALGSSFVTFLFGLWFLANPPAGIP